MIKKLVISCLLVLTVAATGLGATEVDNGQVNGSALNNTTIDLESENVKEDATASEKKAEEFPGLVGLFLTGGWAMWPLLMASVIGLGIVFERMYYFFNTRLYSKGYNQMMSDRISERGLDGAQEYLSETKAERASDVIINGLDVAMGDPDLFAKGVEREAGEVITVLERGLTILAAVSTIAPLIGFLGTVSGMINAFDAIANADQVNAKVVAGGIKEALITTAAGLIVAIPVMAFHQFLSGKVNAFAAEVEEAANKIYKELLRKKGKMNNSGVV